MPDKKAITGFAIGLLFCLLFGYTLVKGSFGNMNLYSAEVEIRHQHYLKRLPREIVFAGEKVHFKTPASYVRFERELRHNTSNNSSTRLLLKNVRIWLPEIEYIIRRHQLPEDFKYLAIAESNLSNGLSHKSAAGFWQFTPETAAELGLEINDEVDERYHPLLATDAACRFFKKSYKVFKNWTSVAASYNRGMNGLKRAFDGQEAENFYDLDLNEETARYMYKILAIKDLVNNPKKYKMNYKRNKSSYIKKIRIDTTVHNLQKLCVKLNITYSALKEYNPWLLKNSLTIKPGKSYIILIPYTEIGIANPKEQRKVDSLKKLKLQEEIRDITYRDYEPKDKRPVNVNIF